MNLMRAMRLSSVALMLTLVANGVAVAASPMDKMDTTIVQAKVKARGIGKEVKITETDKTQLKGVIVKIGEQSFQLKVKDSPDPVEIPYANVSSVHNAGLSTGAKVGIGILIGVVAVVLILAIIINHELKTSPI